MKTLSIRQPWASLIANGHKDIENRSWHTKVRGTILIHASLKPEDTEYPIDLLDQRSLLERVEMDHSSGEWWEATMENTRAINSVLRSVEPPNLGVIVGSVEIIDCVHESDSIWFQGEHGFLLRNAELLPEPIPWKGRLGFFDVDESQVPLYERV